MKSLLSAIFPLLFSLFLLQGQSTAPDQATAKLSTAVIAEKYQEAAAKRPARPAEALEILRMIADSVQELADPVLHFKIQKDLGEVLTALEYDVEQSLFHLDRAIELGELLKDEFKVQEAKAVKAIALLNNGSYEAATELTDDVIQFYEAHQRPVPLAMAMLTKFDIMLDQMVDVALTLNWLVKAQEILTPEDPEHIRAWGMLQQKLGYNFQLLDEQEKALAYFDQAEQVFLEQKDILNLLSTHVNRAQCHVLFKNVEKVDEEVRRIENLMSENDLGDYAYIVYNVIAQVFITQERFELAKTYLENLIAELIQRGNYNQLAVNWYWLGITYRGLDNYAEAAVYFKKGYEREYESGDWHGCSSQAKALYQTYLWRDKHKEALEWYVKSVHFRDRQYNENTRKETSVLKAQLETLEKEKEIEILEAQAKTEAVQKRQLWMGLLMTVLLGAALFYNQRQARKRSKLIQQERLKIAQLQKQQLEQQLHFKQRELTAQVLNLAKKNDLFQNVFEHLGSMKKVANPDSLFYVKKLSKLIETDLNDDEVWEQFLDSFKDIHQNFFRQLTTTFTDLNSTDLRLISLMKMNLSAKEIASLLNISDLGVKKARYRLRKKLRLDSEMNVQDYLLNFG